MELLWNPEIRLLGVECRNRHELSVDSKIGEASEMGEGR